MHSVHPLSRVPESPCVCQLGRLCSSSALQASGMPCRKVQMAQGDLVVVWAV